jgi:probable lipoprotein (TIGR04455 family)
VRNVFTVKPLKPATIPKHVAIAAWAPENNISNVLLAVGTDFIKQYKNFVVRKSQIINRDWSDLCDSKVQGVVLLRVLKSEIQNDDLDLHITAELFDCQSGALVWRSESRGKRAQTNANLKELVAIYVNRLGDSAQQYTAPVFVLLQPLMRSMPSPTPPTDEEVMEILEQ